MTNVKRTVQLVFCLIVLVTVIISCSGEDSSENSTSDPSEKLIPESTEKQEPAVVDLSGKEIPRIGAPKDQIGEMLGQPVSSSPHNMLENALLIRQNAYLLYMILNDTETVVEVTLGPDPEGKLKGKSPALYNITLGSEFKETHMFLTFNGFIEGKELNADDSVVENGFRRRYINEKDGVILWLTTIGEFGDVVKIRARDIRLLEEQF